MVCCCSRGVTGVLLYKGCNCGVLLFKGCNCGVLLYKGCNCGVLLYKGVTVVCCCTRGVTMACCCTRGVTVAVPLLCVHLLQGELLLLDQQTQVLDFPLILLAPAVERLILVFHPETDTVAVIATSSLP